MAIVDTRIGPISYNDQGQGPLVVLLHATLHDRSDYAAIAPALARRYRVLAVDWPGHGDSAALVPPTLASAPLFADVLEDVVNELDLPAGVFIGNSVGGFCAARLAITHPERVAGLVLVNTGGFLNTPITRAYCRVLGTPAVMRRVLPGLVRSYLRAASDNDRAVLNRVLTRARSADGVAMTAALWRSFATPEHDLRGRASRITTPTLIIWGSKDTAIPLRFGHATHRAIPGSRLETLPTGHIPFSSRPAEFLELIQPFLADVLAARPEN